MKLKTILIIDLIMFILGLFIYFGFSNVCRSISGICPQPFIIYIGLAIALFSLIQFIITILLNIAKPNKEIRR
jgi:MFS superfamily sulfate permease-like transporter